MGRIAKRGLEYFPMDVDFFQDIKIRKLIRRQGGKAVAVYALLLCFIYKNGYYIGGDEELPFIISEQTGYDEVYIQEVIKDCLALGLFNLEMYKKENILTSEGIQRRYKSILLTMKRVVRIDKYNLISSEEKGISSEEKGISSEEKGISSEEKGINSEESTLNKKKRKEKKKVCIKKKPLARLCLYSHQHTHRFQTLRNRRGWNWMLGLFLTTTRRGAGVLAQRRCKIGGRRCTNGARTVATSH